MQAFDVAWLESMPSAAQNWLLDTAKLMTKAFEVKADYWRDVRDAINSPGSSAVSTDACTADVVSAEGVVDPIVTTEAPAIALTTVEAAVTRNEDDDLMVMSRIPNDARTKVEADVVSTEGDEPVVMTVVPPDFCTKVEDVVASAEGSETMIMTDANTAASGLGFIFDKLRDSNDDFDQHSASAQVQSEADSDWDNSGAADLSESDKAPVQTLSENDSPALNYPTLLRPKFKRKKLESTKNCAFNYVAVTSKSRAFASLITEMSERRLSIKKETTQPSEGESGSAHPMSNETVDQGPEGERAGREEFFPDSIVSRVGDKPGLKQTEGLAWATVVKRRDLVVPGASGKWSPGVPVFHDSVTAANEPCRSCACDCFEENPYRKGRCSNCFHKHVMA